MALSSSSSSPTTRWDTPFRRRHVHVDGHQDQQVCQVAPLVPPRDPRGRRPQPGSPDPANHVRQDSSNSSASNEVSCFFVSPDSVLERSHQVMDRWPSSSIGSPTSTSWSFHSSGQSPTSGDLLGAADARCRRGYPAPPCPPEPDGGLFRAQPYLQSPSSLSVDLGYHTLLMASPPASGPEPSAPPPTTSTTTTTTSSTRSMEALPDDVLVRILSHLPTADLCRCSRISRRFRSLTRRPCLWSSIYLSPTGGSSDADVALGAILRSLSAWQAQGALNPHPPRARSRRPPPSTAGQRGCLDWVAPVTKIEVVGGGLTSLSDEGLRLISTRCPDLRVLRLPNSPRVTEAGVRSVVTHCSSLAYLDLSGCSGVAPASIGFFEAEDPSPAVAALGGVPPGPSRSLEYLRHLDMSECLRMTDQGLHRIAQSAPHLTHLYLRRCVNVSDIGVKFMSDFCLGLRELSVSDCPLITDSSLLELARLGPNLRYLSVAKCHRLSDLGVQQIARSCYKLRYLNLRGCTLVSDVSLEAISVSCGQRLRSLDIGRCDITDMGVIALADHCQQLRKLSLKGCEMVSDPGIVAVAYSCKKLRRVNIQDCPVTLEGYRCLKSRCRSCIIEHTNPGFS